MNNKLVGVPTVINLINSKTPMWKQINQWNSHTQKICGLKQIHDLLSGGLFPSTTS